MHNNHRDKDVCSKNSCQIQDKKEGNFESMGDIRSRYIYFQWNIHLSCNYRCPYCWFHGRWQDFVKLNRYFSPEQWIQAWRNIYDKYGEVFIEMIGGEPLIYPHITELIIQLSKMHRIKVVTNLSVDIRRFLDQLDPSRVRFDVTYHPLFAETGKFIEKATVLRERGFITSVSYLGYPSQIGMLDYYRARFTEANLSINVLPFWGEHNGIRYPMGYTPGELAVTGLDLAVEEKCDFQLKPNEVKGKICHAGHRYAIIEAQGTVIRCSGGLMDANKDTFSAGYRECLGLFLDEDFKLLDNARPCGAEFCRSNEWTFLLEERSSISRFPECKVEVVDRKSEKQSPDVAIVNSYRESGEHHEEGNLKDTFTINKEVNQRETTEKKSALESKPIKLGITLTNRCNLRCIMCPSQRWNGQHTLSKHALENIYELLPYIDRINWQGGEVFIIDYLKDVLREMQSYGNVTHEITTNGLCLDEEWIGLLLGLDVIFTFSIDSPVASTYEYIRRGARFNSLINRLELLNAMEQSSPKRIHKTITAVVLRANMNELDLFVDFAKKYNFAAVSFMPVMHIDGDENIFNNMTPEIKCILNSKIESAKCLGREHNIEIFNRLPGIGCKDSHTCRIEPHKPQGTFCSLPWTSLWIDCVRGGNVYPDCMCDREIGNINKDRPLNLWNNSTMVTYRENIANNNLCICNQNCVSGLVDPELLHYTS